MKTVIISQELDELGGPEEFTSDLTDLVDADELEHLQDDGLPIQGTIVSAGMLLVGKLARTKDYDRSKLPRSVDYAFHGEEAMREIVQSMLKNTSHYATAGETGKVIESYFDGDEPNIKAVVVIEAIE
ncbi:MAG: hypothetical protein ISQ14_13750 [Verrucomicrobiae bacterium]|nr:hypothetical protein [Verrucomicrobiae bacterium]